MTISSTLRKAGPFTGNGVVTLFPFAFKVFAKTDIELTRTDANGAVTTLVLDSDYSVTLNVNQDSTPGGTIAYPITGSPLPAGATLIGIGDLPYTQPTDITNNGGFYPSVVEDMSDRSTIQIQQLAELSTRTLHFPVSEDNVAGEFPTAGTRADTMFGFDANGNPTYLPIPAAIGAGDMRDEIGSDGKPGFVAGTDFIAGTTAQLILSRAPISKANTWVQFDAAYQGGDQILSVVGNVLAFTAPIPLGTQRVYVRTGTTLSLNIPAQGSVGDASLAPGSRVYNRAFDSADVKDAGAVGDGSADESLALQAMFTNAGKTGWGIPSGIYKFSTSLQSDYSAMTQPPGDRSARGRIRGDSQSNTILRYAGTGYAAHFTGSTTGQGLDSFDTYSDFTLQDNAGAKSNSGIYVLNRGLFKFENILLQYFENGMIIDGSFTAHLDNVHCRNSDNGLVFNGTNFEPPNLIKMTSCTFGGNAKTGVTGNINACINFDSCDISSNGTQGDLTTGGAIFNITASLSGPLTLNGCYFENNAGASDVHIINNSGQPASVVISGCTFNRGLNTNFTLNNITVANVGAGSVTRVLIQGTSFVSVNSYVPSSSRVFLNGDANTEFIDGGGNSFSESVSLSNNPFTHGRTTAGAVAANGTAIHVPPQVTVAKIGTGVYQITHATGFAKDTSNYFPSAISTDSANGALARRVTFVSAAQFNVVMVDGSGNPIDAPFLFQVLQFG